MNKELAVVAVHFNPCNYKKQVYNLNIFREHFSNCGFPLYLMWAKYGEETYDLPWASLTAEARDVMFQKEAMINRLALDLIHQKGYEKIAFIDADLLFGDGARGMLEKANEALNSSKVIQLFKEAFFLSPTGEVERTAKSCLSERNLEKSFRYFRYHPGFAWAARKGLWTECGGLYPYGIIGGGDGLLHLAVTGMWEKRIEQPPLSFNPEMREHFKEWAKRVDEWCERKIGSLTGEVIHLNHGDRTKRRYAERNNLLVDFLPEKHTKINDDGLLEWTREASPELAAYCCRYFYERREDE